MTETIIRERIEAHRENIIEIGRTVWHRAEMGFKEFETAKLVAHHPEIRSSRPRPTI